VVRFTIDVRVPEDVLQQATDRRLLLFLYGKDVPVSGPLSVFCPQFPEDFLETVRATSRRKTAPHHLVQRCRLVLLQHENPHLGQEEAGCRIGLSGRQVLRWRQRWAAGDFSVDDSPGRGRKATFSPPGTGRGQGHRL